MSAPCYCRHCQVVVPPPKTRGWRVLYWLAIGVGPFVPLLFFGVLALFAAVVLPVGALMMGSVLSLVRERAYAEPRCALCHRYALPLEPAPAPAASPVAAAGRSVAVA